MFTPTAAATEIEPLDVDAEGVFVEPELRPPFAPAVEFAWPRSPATWPSTPPAGAPAEPSPGAPAAEADASDSELDEPSACRLIEPAAVTSRCVVASTSWFAMVSASETPIAAEPVVVAEPSAVVSADAVNVAFASSLPVSVSSAPRPIVAFDVMFESAIATDGTIVTPPPEAPVLACVVIACAPWASSVKSCAFIKTAPSPIAASVSSVTIESASAAPSPKLEPPGPLTAAGNAFTIEMLVDLAVSQASPPDASTEAPERIAPAAPTLTMFRPSDPATDTLPPPAPDVPSAPNRFVVSPETSVIDASALNPCATTTAPDPTVARFWTFARLIATPAPIETPPLPPVEAEPSAFAFASVFAVLFNVTAPPAVT